MVTEFITQIFASTVRTKVLDTPNPNLGFCPSFKLFIGIECLVIFVKKVEMCPAGMIVGEGSIIFLFSRSLISNMNNAVGSAHLLRTFLFVPGLCPVQFGCLFEHTEDIGSEVLSSMLLEADGYSVKERRQNISAWTCELFMLLSMVCFHDKYVDPAETLDLFPVLDIFN
jgi:hypothetical protein